MRLFKFFLLIFLAISPDSFAKNKINEISFINDKIIIKASKNIDSKSFILENPPRIVVDLDKSILANKFKKNFTDNNFKKFRYSTSNSKLRLVFDLKNNITISKVISKKADNNFQIEVNLANSNYQKEVIDSKSQIDFANFVYDKVEKLDNKEQKFNSNKVKKSKISSQIIHDKNYNTKKYKPIIVIDPGHGGKDPGAIGRYNKTREKELVNAGVNIVIYANHLLRASYPAMTNIALEILKNKRSFEAEKKLLSINKILRLIPGTI